MSVLSCVGPPVATRRGRLIKTTNDRGQIDRRRMALGWPRTNFFRITAAGDWYADPLVDQGRPTDL
jgi:hypothetical protein